MKSLDGILLEIAKHFHKPDVIDARIKQHFIDNFVPNAPDLTQ